MPAVRGMFAFRKSFSRPHLDFAGRTANQLWRWGIIVYREGAYLPEPLNDHELYRIASGEGRKSIAERAPETVELARKLARARPKGGKRSLREIAATLAEAGHLTKHGNRYAATAIKLMLDRK
ncbi:MULTISPECIES: hypothetical protein [Bradyrhizobium]|jgi:hypothetical protein|uniref:hypothetical protein n=1 Tax=Bradyrhizobium TaxID=374 RepID=UPI00117C981A|nr:hypothetical protein [Bradyrhizobium japonicum]